MNASIPRVTVNFGRSATLLIIACTAFQNPASAVQLKTLVDFNGTNGAWPQAGLVFDATGRLYGTTMLGGSSGGGTVFQLTPPAPGQTTWMRKTLVNFNDTNGSWPLAGLVLDAAGQLYGTTHQGGKYRAGTVFRLTPPAPGQTAWTRKTLTNFKSMYEGFPTAGVVLDKTGNLYGTTYAEYGTVFQLIPPAPGQTAWTHKTLVDFNGMNGSWPQAGLVFDAGHLYGTTSKGGKYVNGTVFQLTPPAPGQTEWTRKTLVNFNGSNGKYPYAELVRDVAGHLYGTTREGGWNNYGTVFQLTPPAPGQTAWTRKTLVNFSFSNGAHPMGGLALDAAGNLYGTTFDGSQSFPVHGTIFRLTPPAPGQTKWTLKTLVNFDGTNGAEPHTGLVIDAAGKLYGTTSAGGQYGSGTVFQLTP